jgi:hypothetical protein
MLARLPLLIPVRLWTALLVAAICLHAGVAAPPALETSHGSAFSAATKEVALLIKRTDRVQRQVVAPQPLASFAVVASIALTGGAVLREPAPRPDSTGPPLGDLHSWIPSPRAPPRA